MSLSTIVLKTIYGIRHWLQPYWIPPAIESRQTVSADSETIEPSSSVDNADASQSVSEEPALTEQSETKPVVESKKKEKESYPTVGPGETLKEPRDWMMRFADSRLSIQEFDHRLTLDPSKLDRLPAPNWTWYHHDKRVHQLLSHLGPTMGYKFKERDSAKRKKLKPLIRITDRQYDRTHLIPFGYHGIESDPRLLIGFDSDMNRGPMNDYEIQQKSWNFPIFWACEVVRQSDHQMTLTYTVWDARTLKRVSQKSFVTKGDIEWL